MELLELASILFKLCVKCFAKNTKVCFCCPGTHFKHLKFCFYGIAIN